MRLALDFVACGEVKIVPVSAPWPKRSLVVVGGAPPRVFWNVCQHLPIPLDAGAGSLPPGPLLICTTHGAAYRKDDGYCERGPCKGTTLESVAVEERDGKFYALVGL